MAEIADNDRQDTDGGEQYEEGIDVEAKLMTRKVWLRQLMKMRRVESMLTMVTMTTCTIMSRLLKLI